MKKLLLALSLCSLSVMSWSTTLEYEFPSVDGERLDRCLMLGRKCGRVVAHKWCKVNNFEKAIYWEVDWGTGYTKATKTLVSEEVCRGSSCDSFRRIVCFKNSTPE